MTARTLSGRGWAYTGAILGGLTSVAANIAHSYVPPQHAPAGWAPKPGAVVGAIVWPVFLLVAVEILARVAWPHGWSWQLLRWAGMVPVGLVAALVSYRHLSGLLAFYGEEPLVGVLGPLAVDGLMVMATGALLALSQHHTSSTTPISALRTDQPQPVPVPAGPGLAPSADPTPTSPSTPDTPAPSPVVDPIPAPDSVPATPDVPTPAVVATRITGADTTSTGGSAVAFRPAARTPRPRPSIPDPTPAKPLAAPAPDTPVTAPEPAQLPLPQVVAPELLTRAREVARTYRTEHGTSITPGQLAVRLKVTSGQASQALAVLGLGPDSPTQQIPTVNGHRPSRAAR
jgi:hypothetical protein